ncbi:MAG: phage tail tape measure protein [Clostridia bacterium]|nr:phage tail tape measure protein [Clostridia bacterium]
MSNPNIGVSFNAKNFNAEVRSMKEELSGAKKEFQITDEQLKRTGGTIDQLKSKVEKYGDILNKQSGLTQKYRSGIDGLNQSLSDAKEKQRKATEELTKAQKAKDTDEKTLKKLNQEVQKANRQVETYEKKLTAMKKSLQDSTLQEEKLKTTLKNTNDELKKQESFVGRVKSQLDEYNKKTKDITRGLDSAGNALTKSVTVPLVAAAGAAVKFSTDFNASLANISTLGVSTERVVELKSGIRELAVEVAKDTGDISNGVYNVISAIGDSNETLKITKINAKAAAAGLATTEEAIGLTTAVTKGYNDITADAFQKASDLAFVTVKLGQTTFPELANAIGRVVPASNALGISQEELFTVYATLTGVTGKASEVSTQYGAILSGLMKPSESMKKMLSQLGYESGFAMVKTLGLKGTLDALTTATGGSEEKLSDLVSSKEAVTAMLALTGAQAENFTNKLTAMNEAAGASEEAFAAQSDGVNKAGFQFQQSMVSMQVAAQKFGDAAVPYIDKASDAISGLADWLNSLSDEQRDAVLNVGLFAAALGPTLKVTSGLITNGSKILAVLKAIGPTTATAAAGMTATASGATALGSAMTALSGPVGWTIAALAALTVGGIALAKGLDEADKAFYNMGDAAEEAAAKLDECEQRTATVDEMAEKYANLKEQIASGKLTEQELEQAEAQRNETEQWFIENYGDFISAEEQKNGIRDKSVEKIQQYVASLREQSKLELQATVMENSAKEPKLRQDISDLEASNVELEKQRDIALTNKIALLELRNEIKALNLAEAEGKDVTEQRNAVAQKAYELTGVRTAIEADIIQLANNQTIAVEKLNAEIEQNNQKVEDGNETLEQNALVKKRLIELASGLDGSIEKNTEKLKNLKKAEDEFNKAGKISEETLDKLVKKFPELGDMKKNPELLKDEIKKLEEGLALADEKATELGTTLDGYPKEIDTKVKVSFSAANWEGFKARLGPVANQVNYTLLPGAADGGEIQRNELSFVNEEGLEFIEDKNGRFRYVQSDGPALTKLLPGDKVYTAEESRRMMNAKSVYVPGFKKGTEEEKRLERVKAYEVGITDFEADDVRWQKLQEGYGTYTDNDYEYGLKQRIQRYQSYIKEILTLDYMTAEEKEKLIGKYTDIVEDTQLELFKHTKKVGKNSLDEQLKLSEKYVSELAKSGDLAGDSWEAIIGRVSARYNKAVEDGKMTAEEAAEAIAGFTDFVYEERTTAGKRYDERVSAIEADDSRWQSLQEGYGNYTDNDISYVLAERIRRYQGYINEVMAMDNLTEEEKERLIGKYQDIVEDTQLELFQHNKESARDTLDEQLKLSEKYVSELAKSGDLAGDSWEAIIGRVSARYHKAVEDGKMTAEEAAEAIAGFTDFVFSSRISNAEKSIDNEVFYGRLNLPGQIAEWTKVLQIAIEEGNTEKADEIYKTIYKLKTDYAQDYFDSIMTDMQKYYDAERQEILDKYDEIDRLEAEEERAEKKENILEELKLYKNAVTVEGKNRYNELLDELEDIEKEEERAKRESKKEAELEELDDAWERYQASSSTILENLIQSYGIAGGSVGEISRGVEEIIIDVLSRLNQLNLDVFGTPLSTVVNYNNYYQTNNQRISDPGLASMFAGYSINQFKLGV